MPAPSTATPATAEDTVEHTAEHTAQKAGNGVPMPADGPRHRMLETDSCTRWLGGEVLLAEPGHAKLRMRVREEMTNGFKIAHGGMIFTLADTCFAMACNHPDGDDGTITVASGPVHLTSDGQVMRTRDRPDREPGVRDCPGHPRLRHRRRRGFVLWWRGPRPPRPRSRCPTALSSVAVPARRGLHWVGRPRR